MEVSTIDEIRDKISQELAVSEGLEREVEKRKELIAGLLNFQKELLTPYSKEKAAKLADLQTKYTSLRDETYKDIVGLQRNVDLLFEAEKVQFAINGLQEKVDRRGLLIDFATYPDKYDQKLEDLVARVTEGFLGKGKLDAKVEMKKVEYEKVRKDVNWIILIALEINGDTSTTKRSDHLNGVLSEDLNKYIRDLSSCSADISRYFGITAGFVSPHDMKRCSRVSLDMIQTQMAVDLTWLQLEITTIRRNLDRAVHCLKGLGARTEQEKDLVDFDRIGREQDLAAKFRVEKSRVKAKKMKEKKLAVKELEELVAKNELARAMARMLLDVARETKETNDFLLDVRKNPYNAPLLGHVVGVQKVMVSDWGIIWIDDQILQWEKRISLVPQALHADMSILMQNLTDTKKNHDETRQAYAAQDSLLSGLGKDIKNLDKDYKGYEKECAKYKEELAGLERAQLKLNCEMEGLEIALSTIRKCKLVFDALDKETMHRYSVLDSANPKLILKKLFSVHKNDKKKKFVTATYKSKLNPVKSLTCCKS